ncbi:MAG: 30S ribosomal protein S20 [Patescibacteria group bacterium]|nr:30S ribosomal protein S20 [Patescibacteria group bacterium]MCL5093680.1 30S ribosomal protein S20 [Patescibacteria group bacterium]
MPITKSAIKRARQNKKRREHNRELKEAFRIKVKDILKKGRANNLKEAEKLIPEAYKALDKAAKRGTIHKNAAARRKSRLVKKLNALQAKKKETPKKEK